jgi:beta-lactamase class D
MYKDTITYQLSKNTTEDHLLSVAKRIIEEWMSKQTGFQKWEIHKNSDSSYTDIVFWDSEEDAKKAEKEMVNIPNASEWFACYKEGTISSKKLHKIAQFK